MSKDKNQPMQRVMLKQFSDAIFSTGAGLVELKGDGNDGFPFVSGSALMIETEKSDSNETVKIITINKNTDIKCISTRSSHSKKDVDAIRLVVTEEVDNLTIGSISHIDYSFSGSSSFKPFQEKKVPVKIEIQNSSKKLALTFTGKGDMTVPRLTDTPPEVKENTYNSLEEIIDPVERCGGPNGIKWAPYNEPGAWAATIQVAGIKYNNEDLHGVALGDHALDVA
ncbi:hypothetical protein [Candidatus Tisiphia endosymbiont of Nemotelus uliginosus]|uniref:hypothetical protein n=1 Tax=Candidatus Tisiphia endosymbiont of Nemotelus uliginosus TaxID=3077926 RepID=UPI0035C92E19